MKKLIVVALLSVLGLSACGSSGGTVTNMNSAAFAQKISDSAVVILDVRRSDEFAAGHLESALHIDVEAETFENEVAKLDKTKTYAVYCHSGRRSLIAIDAMKNDGFTSLVNLEGGISDWISTGHSVVTS
jgi:rhodanese-related sulfurtransferase